MSSPTVEEVIQKRTEIENKISKLVDDFQEETGLVIQDIDVTNIELTSFGSQTPEYKPDIRLFIKLGQS